MPYKRTFTKQEIHDLLYQSECRKSPTTQASGHTMALHGDLRADVTDQRVGEVFHLAKTIELSRAMDPDDGVTRVDNYIPPVDGRFSSRLDLISALHQALNGAAGQNALQELDSTDKKRVSFTAQLSTPIKNVEKFVKSGQTKSAGLTAHAAFVLLDRLSEAPECAIHLQTAYPKNLQ